MRKKTLWIIFVLILICTTIGNMSVGTASVSSPPVMSIDPATSTAAPGETFTINVTVADIAENDSLYGWEAEISFNPDIVNVTRVTSGPFLRDAAATYGYTTIFVKTIDNVNGSFKVGESIFPKFPPDDPYPPVGATGNGTLATITLTAKAEGSTLLHFEENQHKLFTIKLDNLIEITHDVTDGLFEYPLRVHDVAVTNITANPKTALPGEIIFINVTVENQGDFSENVSVTISYDATDIETSNATLSIGESRIVQFNWDTTDVTPGTYNITARATVAVDDDQTDNIRSSETWVIDVIPEFSTLLPLMLLLAAMAVFALLLKRRTGAKPVDAYLNL